MGLLAASVYSPSTVSRRFEQTLFDNDVLVGKFFLRAVARFCMMWPSDVGAFFHISTISSLKGRLQFGKVVTSEVVP